MSICRGTLQQPTAHVLGRSLPFLMNVIRRGTRGHAESRCLLVQFHQYGKLENV